MERLRTCIVKGRPAYFHKWSDKSSIVPRSFDNGHLGGINYITVGIIEYKENGAVTECYPNEIRFTNRFINDTDEEILIEEKK